MKEGPPPILLLFIAALLAIAGGVAITQLIAGFFHDSFILSPLLVGIPAGLGLLSLREGTRKWVEVCSAICALSVLVIAGLAAYRMNAPLPAAAHVSFEIPEGIIAFVVSGGIWLTLRSKRMQAWFTPEGNHYATANKWWHTLILLGIFLGALWELKDLKIRRSIATVYEVDTTFVGVDGSTGQSLMKFNASIIPDSATSLPIRKLSTIYHALSSTQTIRIDGYTNEPAKLLFTSPGKKPITYSLTSESPREVTLTFEPDRESSGK